MSTPSHPQEARKIVQALLDEKRILQKDLSRSAQIPTATLSMFLSGQRKPSIPLLQKCAEVLGLDSEELIGIQKGYETWSQTAEGRRVIARETRQISAERLTSGPLANWQIKLHIDMADLMVVPYDKAELKLASLDLTRGEFARASKISKRLPSNEALEIQKGESVLIYSREKVSLPSFLSGRAGGISFHILHGISVSFGLQLDPLFSGHPFALFTNHGSDPFPIEPGDPCLSVEFSYLAAEPDLEMDEV